jgi:hypothetical protein
MSPFALLMATSRYALKNIIPSEDARMPSRIPLEEN